MPTSFSPIDLIPDLISVLWFLDDAILLPFGIRFTLRFNPGRVIDDARARAEEQFRQPKPARNVGDSSS